MQRPTRLCMVPSGGHIPVPQTLKQQPSFHAITVLTLMVITSPFVPAMLHSSPCVACWWLLQGSKGLMWVVQVADIPLILCLIWCPRGFLYFHYEEWNLGFLQRFMSKLCSSVLHLFQYYENYWDVSQFWRLRLKCWLNLAKKEEQWQKCR